MEPKPETLDSTFAAWAAPREQKPREVARDCLRLNDKSKLLTQLWGCARDSEHMCGCPTRESGAEVVEGLCDEYRELLITKRGLDETLRTLCHENGTLKTRLRKHEETTKDGNYVAMQLAVALQEATSLRRDNVHLRAENEQLAVAAQYWSAKCNADTS